MNYRTVLFLRFHNYYYLCAMIHFIDLINEYLWTLVILVLVGCAIYFTIRSRGVQFCNLRDMIRITLGRDSKEKKKIGSFQAFAVSLASRVGTGNLAGVASAIFVGGPGAIFWMWIMALLGSATAFVEATLAQLYKRKGEDSYYGGPAYYMTHGLHRKWMGILFAVLITLTFGIANQVVQSNTLISALSNASGWNGLYIGIALAVMTMVIIFGGIQRIAKFTSLCVPFMAIGFIIISLYVILTNIGELPRVFKLIFDGAFGIKQVTGGLFGATIMQGVRRGLFSNEAGEGSAPNAAAIADTSHPIKQGMIQALGVFIDTLVICTCTAMIILISGVYESDADGIILTTNALEHEIGPTGKYFITAAIFLFAYSTIIANYFYGETNIRFINSSKKYIVVFRVATGAVVLLAAWLTLQEAWSMVDVMMGLMTMCNLAAIFPLSKHVWVLLDDYLKQRKAGKEPTFHRSQMPDIQSDIDCWE